MTATTENAPKKHHDAPMTKSDIYFALDCEMVGVGPEGLASVVARVTLVNWENEIVLDTFVKVPVPVTDYRTQVSGITAKDIQSENVMTYEEVRTAVKKIIRGKILIGHGLENDLTALGLTHPWCDVRDTACYASYMREVVDPQTGKLVVRPRKLRDLAWEVLGRLIQLDGNAHCPIEDAIASLDLYKAARLGWEKDLSQQQRAQEAEKQERRFKYNFFSNTMSQTPPPEFGVYNMIEPHNVHLLPIPIDPRLPLPDPYAGYPGYSPMLEPREEILPPPPREEILPPPPSLASLSPSSWFRFVLRPKTPPLGEEQEEKKANEQEATERTEEENEMEPIDLDLDHILPDLQYLSLDSQVSSADSCVGGGLPFYSESTIWRQG
jgi:RNA exonuclease 4